MKRLIFLFASIVALTASAEVITMDLSTAEDVLSIPLVYNSTSGDGYYDCTDVWEHTYNDNDNYRVIYVNDGHFVLSHLPSQNSYNSMSWEGFTVSKVSQDTANVFGCVANGGVAGVGTPYVIGYFSEWVTQTLGYSSNTILFDHYYYPEHIYICQNSNTMEAIARGGVFNANVFTEQDTLSLIISALDENMQEIASITYYLAVDGKKNNGWEKVSLSSLGKAAGLSFRMTTTDIGDYGANTPMYFALDGLTVNSEQPAALHDIIAPTTNTQKIIRNGELLIIYGEQTYSITGARR